MFELTSDPQTSGTYCPGPVNFTCVGTDIGSSFFWNVNGTTVASYPYRTNDLFPRRLTINLPLDGVVVEITNASQLQNGNYNITSTFNVLDISDLTGTLLQCQSGGNEKGEFNILRIIELS